MAELVDALVLGTNMATCEGSSPFRPTINFIYESYCRKQKRFKQGYKSIRRQKNYEYLYGSKI